MKNETNIIKKRYDRYSIFYNFLESIPEKLFISKWSKKYITPLKGKILEIGVGTGKNLQYYSKDANVTGIDISSGMLNKAIKKSNRLKRNYSLLKMDAQDLKFKNNSFDIVVFTFVLCSVPDPVKTAEEIKRVCKPNGKIVMIEHVLSKNKFIAFLQYLHNPITKFLLGFNIDRDTISNIKKAGLKITIERNLKSNDIFKFLVCKLNKK